jgi:3-deoxy-D-arabino-heptulosonate 7-phosphate (DAHP) synthase
MRNAMPPIERDIIDKIKRKYDGFLDLMKPYKAARLISIATNMRVYVENVNVLIGIKGMRNDSMVNNKNRLEINL